MSFKPVTPIPTFLGVGIVICLLSFSTNWVVVAILIVLFAYIMYGEIPYMREKLKANKDFIIIQNIDCIEDGKRKKLKEISIRWSDIQSIDFEFIKDYHCLIVKTKNKYLVPSNIYYKEIGHYYLTRRRRQLIMKTIYQLYRNHNYLRH